MKTSRETYTTETPALVFPEPLTEKPIVQALPVPPCNINARGNRGSKMKCITQLWDLNIPTELLQDILSRLRLKDNIHASAVCKTWCELAVYVRKLQPRPWFFYKQQSSLDGGDYVLSDPSRSQTYKLNFPELKRIVRFCYSKDGWLLVENFITCELLLLNPFTREHIYLPKVPGYFRCLAVSAAPTSSSCLVIALDHRSIFIYISMWRYGETVWTTYCFEDQLALLWNKCVFSNGMFYCLSICGCLGVFDPSKATWNNLLVKPFPVDCDNRMSMTEHEGDIFVFFTRFHKNPLVFKLNLKGNVWEETRELGGLTVFASFAFSLTRACLPSEMRNKIYTSHFDDFWRHDIYYYSLDDEYSSRPPVTPLLSPLIVCVDPPHNVDL